MANALYPKGKAAVLSGGFNLLTDTMRWVLVDLADYTYSANHEFLSDIPSAARVSTSNPLANKSVTSGVFDADDPTFTAAAGDVSEAVVLYKDTGSASTSRLLLFIDTATGLPVIPNTGDIVLQFDNGANKIFAI